MNEGYKENLGLEKSAFSTKEWIFPKILSNFKLHKLTSSNSSVHLMTQFRLANTKIREGIRDGLFLMMLIKREREMNLNLKDL